MNEYIFEITISATQLTHKRHCYILEGPIAELEKKQELPFLPEIGDCIDGDLVETRRYNTHDNIWTIVMAEKYCSGDSRDPKIAQQELEAYIEIYEINNWKVIQKYNL